MRVCVCVRVCVYWFQYCVCCVGVWVCACACRVGGVRAGAAANGKCANDNTSWADWLSVKVNIRLFQC